MGDQNKTLLNLQIILKAFAPSGYTGNVEGKLDPNLSSAIDKTITHIKNKLPEDLTAKNLSISVDAEGKVSGSVKDLASLISKLSNPLYKLFQKSPFYSLPINNEEELKKAISVTRSGIHNLFASSSKINEIMTEFDNTVKNKNVKELENSFGKINAFLNEQKETNPTKKTE